MEYRGLNRSFDGVLLNYFLNHSKIFPHIAHDGIDYLDGSKLLDDKNNYFFTFPNGSLLFLHCGDNIYKLDCYFLPRKRGALAKHNIEKSIQYMFKTVKAEKIVAEASTSNKPSRYMIGSLGFNRVSVKKEAWLKEGLLYDIIVYERVNG